ncbi:hypothetical protein LBBP_02093 [Leptospira borgpetersenii serovar Ballum]|uniref:Uncharacterized protein n=1 Tax=Leptospira borgpetersenii serovar Ballum TaxID=280505 RepID=A0A0S2ISR3_LEPBO|nr:hypothetical protein LBBP_02093 [Leptospira borgpetersenii serovar Ballum]
MRRMVGKSSILVSLLIEFPQKELQTPWLLKNRNRNIQNH